MRAKYLALRILHQIRHDKRTLALMFAAPVLLLTLVFFVLNSSVTEYTVGIANAPLSYIDQLAENNVSGFYCSRGEAENLLEQGDIQAYIEIVNNKSYIYIDGTNSSTAQQIINKLEASKLSHTQSRPDLLSEVIYVYGSEDLEMFDNFGSALIGIIIFFFVFLVAGISFLQERTSGTLERLLSTPIKRWEVVAGYALGFGTVTVLQSFWVTLCGLCPRRSHDRFYFSGTLHYPVSFYDRFDYGYFDFYGRQYRVSNDTIYTDRHCSADFFLWVVRFVGCLGEGRLSYASPLCG